MTAYIPLASFKLILNASSDQVATGAACMAGINRLKHAMAFNNTINGAFKPIQSMSKSIGRPVHARR